MSQDTTEILTILHTNDIHSHFEMMSGNAAVISREKKAAENGTVLVLDIGDHMDRAAMETEGTMGQANVDVINLTGYDAITIGNNEGLTVPLEDLSAAYAGLQCPVVCCNIKEIDGGKPPSWMKEYIILERTGIKIGITAATAAFSSFYQLLGWEAQEPVAKIRQQVEFLRSQVDVVILMSHLGINADKNIAEQVSGIDIILGGHTHHLLEEPLILNGTVVCGAGKFGGYVGKVILERKREDSTFQYRSGGVIPVGHHEIHTDVELAILQHREQADHRLQETAALTGRELTLDYTAESPFANLLAQAVYHYTDTDLAIVNAGQLLGPLPSGTITDGMIHALCPSPINPCVMTLKGSYILQALEESLIPDYYNREIKGYGFRGRVLGVLALDGIQVSYDLRRPEGNRIVQAIVQGKPLELDKKYRVGTLDMFTFKVGYESLSWGENITYLLPEFIRDLLRQELIRPGALEQSFYQRWL
ncbi:bifunctional metallophosphatase/5'-nucleotidase [Paenibacillus lemnae]|uniref:Bifunctional metallophosphatase/5'-nucleotidase n=1 Tax=Paenibacillus lemnae TaxID=1330551 RepID=A0A848M7I5_PAELE|nr:bifunctional UDP-sugar hydrolase/5'-nucleotidase [Paenibacillus lemnae]NMO95524.1 bifunctional metallophosphatase/5'-nucleotidase [Paenibacillus lemnae]